MGTKLALASLILAAALLPAGAVADSRDFTGWVDLKTRLGDGMPAGAGVVVFHVEAEPSAGQYLPFIGLGTGEFAGKEDIDLTGGGSVSSHANTVGKRWYGNTLGYAPAIVLIKSYSASDFLTNVLKWSQPQSDSAAFAASLDPGDVRIINNSWISTSATDSARRAIRRADFQTDVYDLIYVNGVNNGSATTIPAVMASSYNGIAVGLDNGNSSHGPTTFEGTRAKPDIVSPDTATSWATPEVAGAIAMLLEQGADLGLAESGKPQAIKAILMAGAEKQADWEKGDAGPEDDAVHPLDWTYGAGKLRVDHNYDTMAGGWFLANTGAPLPRRAWSYDLIEELQTDEFYVHIATGDTTLSAALAWHRHHTGNFSIDGVHFLNNIALELWETDESLAPTNLVQESRSLNDNIQHISATRLGRGVYLVRLIKLTNYGPGSEWYGLAWWSDGEIVLGDMNGDGLVNSGDIPAFVLAFTNPAAYAQQFPGIERELWGDINQDGLFNAADIPAFVDLLTGS